jgi:hypothetical protein
MDMVFAQVTISDYTNRVLGVVKAKFGLKDKSAAINKFAELFGDEFVERQASEAYVAKMLKMSREHHKKHPQRTMTLDELDKLLGR